PAGDAGHRAVDGGLRADARDRRPRRLPARRRGRARGCRGLRAPRRSGVPHRLGRAHGALAQLPRRAPVAGGTRPAAAPLRTLSPEGEAMTALVQTIPTPDGALTILVDEAQRVLASGWTDDHAAIIARVHPALRPVAVAEGETDAAHAARAFY